MSQSGNIAESDLQARLVDKLKTLIMYKTVTKKHDEVEKALSWIQNQFDGLPVFIKKVYCKDFPSLLITTKDTKCPDIWLQSHLDVVPGKDSQFIPIIKEGKLFARGAYDMKLALAIFIELFQNIGQKLNTLNIGIMITSDEEIGGFCGVKYLLESGYSSKVVLIPDGGFNWHIEEQAKGPIFVNFTANGVTGHGSRPWEGENAINKLQNYLSEVQKYMDNREKLDPNYFTTCTLTKFEGGKAMNQIPDFAKATMDIRVVPNDNAESILEHFRKIAKQDKFKGIALNDPVIHPAHVVNLNSQYIKKFQESARQLYNIQVDASKSHGASDARFFGEKNIPALIISCNGGNIHADDEWVDIADLCRFHNVVKKWIFSLSTEASSMSEVMPPAQKKQKILKLVE